MAVVIEIMGAYQLAREFEAHGRGESFSFQGYDALYDYLGSLSDSDGEDVTIDVVALCGDYAEVEPQDFEDYEFAYLIEELQNGNRLYCVT